LFCAFPQQPCILVVELPHAGASVVLEACPFAGRVAVMS